MITFSRYEIRTEPEETPLVLYASDWKAVELSQEYQSFLSERRPGSVQIMEQKYVCDSIDGAHEPTREKMEQLKGHPDTKILGSQVLYKCFGDQERSDASRELFSNAAAELDKWNVWNIRKEAGFTLKKGKELEYQKLKQVNMDDGYGSGVFDYLKRWAAMMEERIEKGEPVNKVAKQTSISADTDGITGAMYGRAVETLSEYWEHGEQLRKWHNSQYSYTGSGVVDPATLLLAPGETEADEMEEQAPQMHL